MNRPSDRYGRHIDPILANSTLRLKTQFSTDYTTNVKKELYPYGLQKEKT